MYSDADAGLARLAQAQHQVVSREQALGLGLTDRMIARRLASGQLQKVVDGVYALPGAPPSLQRDAMAACLRLGPACVASHETAARLHDLPYVAHTGPVVTVPYGGTGRCSIAVVHRTRHLASSDRTLVDGVPATSLARTLIDLAVVVRPIRLERIVDAALASRAVTLEEIDDAFDGVGRGGRRGRGAIGRILLQRGAGSVVPESVLEARFLALVRAAAIDPPVLQARPAWLPTCDGRVDLAWPSARVVVEADGRRWHSRDADDERDRRRDNAAVVAGWRVLRFTWSMVTREPEAVIAALRAVLRSAAA